MLSLLLIILLSSPSDRELINPPFSFDDVFNTTIRPRYASIQWLNSGNGYIREKEGIYWRVDLTGGNVTRVMWFNATDIRWKKEDINSTVNVARYEVTNDEKYLLIETNSEPVRQLYNGPPDCSTHFFMYVYGLTPSLSIWSVLHFFHFLSCTGILLIVIIICMNCPHNRFSLLLLMVINENMLRSHTTLHWSGM